MNTEKTDKTATPALAGRVFYDAECALCLGLAERFRGLLRRRRIDLQPLQALGVPDKFGIRAQDLLKEMRFLTESGQVFGGAEAVVQIARRIWWGWPLFALSRLPGAMSALARLYPWIAQRRNCADGPCRRKQPNRVLDWLPLAVLPLFALNLKPILPEWGFMWAMAFAIFSGCKWLTWWNARESRGRSKLPHSLAYLLAWPGMDAGSFLRKGATTPKPTALGWCFAAVKALLGIGLIWRVVGLVQEKHPLLAGWVGLAGLAFLLHFGSFDLLALLWRQAGFNATPIMRAPILATSLTEFWGKRWNAAFHQLAHAYAFQPLRRRVGPKVATLFVFFISGLVHEAVISLPAGGGYGLPTAYFLFQGLGLLFERSKPGRWLGLGRGLQGRLFTVVCAAGPAFWLFHPPFIGNVILPFLREIGAT